MNSEIERAFGAALKAAFENWQVEGSLASVTPEVGRQLLVVDASEEGESPASTLWRQRVTFRWDVPALVDEADQAPVLRELQAELLTWLRDKPAVVAAFDSEILLMLGNYHISTAQTRQEGDRLIGEVGIVAGFVEI